jgi:tetratricopeptide (TPR) repeat protein
MKHSLPMLFAFCLILIAARAGATQLTVCDAAIQDTPGRWSVDSRTSCRAVLKKRFESNGYWHDEWISIQAAADNYDHLQDTLNDLYKRYDFRLVDRERLDFAKMSAPFWIMYKSGEGDEAIWLALVLHRGLTYSVELRASTLDISAVTEFGQILGAFDFLPDNREEAWTALSTGDAAGAERKFSALVNRDQADANARYGYGLALLAQGNARGAAAEIEQARPQLGISEDARRALGLAALDRGQFTRAAALWIQVIRDNPDREKELRPWIMAAILRSPLQASAPKQPDFEALANDGGVLLYILQAIDRRNMANGPQPVSLDEDSFNAVRADLSTRLSSALDAAAGESAHPVNLRSLLAAIDIERGGGLAATALFGKWDDDTFFRAEVLIATAIRDMSASDDATR